VVKGKRAAVAFDPETWGRLQRAGQGMGRAEVSLVAQMARSFLCWADPTLSAEERLAARRRLEVLRARMLRAMTEEWDRDP
jgi:hypothetical protein